MLKKKKIKSEAVTTATDFSPSPSSPSFFLFLCSVLQILPGVRIIIANPETKGPLGDSHLGEVAGHKLLLSFFFPVLHLSVIYFYFSLSSLCLSVLVSCS